MSVRNRCLAGVLCSLLAIASAVPASAGCTASVNCNNGCSLSFVCLSSPWMLSCSAPSQVRQCTGTTSCLVGSNYVQCDGQQIFCSAAPQCTRTKTSVTCAGTTASCSTCSPGAPGCFIAP